MKTKSNSLLSLLCAGIVAIVTVVPFSGWGQGTKITTYCGITPTTITQSNLNSIINAMMAGNPSTGAWTFIPNGSTISIAQIFGTSGTGNLINYGLKIVSSTPFTLGQIQWSMVSPYASSSGTFGGQGLTYDQFGIGINYGPDGIPGTADDIRYTTGNANTPVNVVYLLGMYDTVDIENSSVSSALNTWALSCPFTEKVTYSVNGTNASAQITYAATPPALSIFHANGNKLAVAWPVFQFTNLQQNSNLNSTNWVAVTNTQNIVGSGTQVIVTNIGTCFYRLKFP